MRQRLAITTKERELVRSSYYRLSAAEQAATLGIDPKRVYYIRSMLRRERALGTRRLRWSAAQVAEAQRLIAQGQTLEQVAAALGRPVRSVRAKLAEAGTPVLALRDRVWTIETAAPLFGVSTMVIRKWLLRGLLKSERRDRPQGAKGAHHRIGEAHLRAFLRDRMTWMEWEPAQITDPQLRALAADIRLHSPYHWLTVAQVAARLHQETTTVQGWLRSGVLRGTRYGNSPWSIWSADLEGFVAPLDAYVGERRSLAARLGHKRKKAA